MEVLVALLVLSIGLLGLAALQAQGLKFNHDAYLRSQATVLVNDIVERMRANRDSADPAQALDEYTEALGANDQCNPLASSAKSDVKCWQDTLAAQLPGGNGAIAAVVGTPGQYDISVSWIDRESNDPQTTVVWRVSP